jgi:hypothetical protein
MSTPNPKIRPQITGAIQENINGTYKPVAKVAIWKQPNKQGNQPTHKGTITYPNGAKQQIALWEK